MEGRATGSQGFGRGTESEQQGRGRGSPLHESSDAALSDDSTSWNQLSPLPIVATTPHFPSPSSWDEITSGFPPAGFFPAGDDSTSASHQFGARTDPAFHPLVTPSGQEHLDQSSVPSTSTTTSSPMISSDPPRQVVQQFQQSTEHQLQPEVHPQFDLDTLLEQNVPITTTEGVIAGQSHSHARGRLGARGRGGRSGSAQIPTRLGRGHGSGSAQILTAEQEAPNRLRQSQIIARTILRVRRQGRRGRGVGGGRGRGGGVGGGRD